MTLDLSPAIMKFKNHSTLGNVFLNVKYVGVLVIR